MGLLTLVLFLLVVAGIYVVVKSNENGTFDLSKGFDALLRLLRIRK